VIRNTWESILDMGNAILGVGHGVLDIVEGMVEDVRNAGNHVGSWVGGKDNEDVGMDEDEIAELIQNVRKSKK
jgi:hypothetical protein